MLNSDANITISPGEIDNWVNITLPFAGSSHSNVKADINHFHLEFIILTSYILYNEVYEILRI
ncbi:MAG: hypothetical protein JST82_14900 [Bacteroidetes bacterium]|nr:hypothetical protein [Bacteroidota bacterium]